MTFCNRCGQQVLEGSRFCSGCGNPIGAVKPKDAAPEAPPQIVYLPATQQNVQVNIGKKPPDNTGCGCLVIIVIIIVIWCYCH